jgi:hypothetical protein
MPKPRGGVFKAVQRDTRYAPVIENALKHPWGTVHKTPPIATDELALDVQRGVYRSARHAGVSAKVHEWERTKDGIVIRFQLFSKAAGKKAVAEHVQNGGTLAYNLRRDKDT